MPKIIRVNKRGQVSIGWAAPYEYYAAVVDDQDRIILTPVTVQQVKREVDPGVSQA